MTTTDHRSDAERVADELERLMDPLGLLAETPAPAPASDSAPAPKDEPQALQEIVRSFIGPAEYERMMSSVPTSSTPQQHPTASPGIFARVSPQEIDAVAAELDRLFGTEDDEDAERVAEELDRMEAGKK